MIALDDEDEDDDEESKQESGHQLDKLAAARAADAAARILRILGVCCCCSGKLFWSATNLPASRSRSLEMSTFVLSAPSSTQCQPIHHGKRTQLEPEVPEQFCESNFFHLALGLTKILEDFLACFNQKEILL